MLTKLFCAAVTYICNLCEVFFQVKKGRHCCTNWHKLCKGTIPLLFQKAEALRFHVQFEWGAHLQNGLRSQVTHLMGWVTLLKKCHTKWKVPALDHPSGSTYFLEADLVTRSTYLWANMSCLQLHFVGQPRPVIQRRINSLTLLSLSFSTQHEKNPYPEWHPLDQSRSWRWRSRGQRRSRRGRTQTWTL